MSDKSNNPAFYLKELMIHQRKSLNLTLRDLSILTDYSFQTLSKYESGKIEVVETNRGILFEHLKIKSTIVDYMTYQLKDDMDALLEAIVFDDEDEIDAIGHRIEQAEIYIEFSPYKHFFLMTQYVLSIITNENRESYDLALSSINQMDSYIKQWVLNYQAIDLLQANDLINALKTIEASLSLGQHELNAGILYYHAGRIYSVYGQLLKAKFLTEKAEERFIKDRNHKRLINAQVQLAILQSRLGSYNQSRRNYSRLLKGALSNHDTFLSGVILHNLAWMECKDKNYQASLDYLNQLESVSQLDENSLVTKMLCLSLLGQKDSSNILYEKVVKSFKDPLYRTFAEVIHLENLNRLDQQYEETLMSLYNLSKDKRDYENVEMSIDRLIAYYESNRAYKKSNALYKEKLSLKDWAYHLE